MMKCDWNIIAQLFTIIILDLSNHVKQKASVGSWLCEPRYLDTGNAVCGSQQCLTAHSHTDKVPWLRKHVRRDDTNPCWRALTNAVDSYRCDYKVYRCTRHTTSTARANTMASSLLTSINLAQQINRAASVVFQRCLYVCDFCSVWSKGRCLEI